MISFDNLYLLFVFEMYVCTWNRQSAEEEVELDERRLNKTSGDLCVNGNAFDNNDDSEDDDEETKKLREAVGCRVKRRMSEESIANVS